MEIPSWFLDFSLNSGTTNERVSPSKLLKATAKIILPREYRSEVEQKEVFEMSDESVFGERRIWHHRPTQSGNLTYTFKPDLATELIETAKKLPKPSLAITDRYVNRVESLAVITAIGCNIQDDTENEESRPFVIAMAAGNLQGAFGDEALKFRPLSMSDLNEIATVRLHWINSKLVDLAAYDQRNLSIPYYFGAVKLK